jgi:hypothetical protein
MLDNPMGSAKVAHRHEECNSRVEIVPNTFGGVNTHLWRDEAYIVGIVPYSPPFLYSPLRDDKPSRRILRLPGVVSGKSKIRIGRCLFRGI